MGRPWSKLQKELYNLLLTKELGLQLHTTTYPIRDGWKGKGNKRGFPRYWFTLGKTIVWDWPKDFMEGGRFNWSEFHGWSIAKENSDKKPIGKYFDPNDEKYGKSTTTIANLIEEYIHTPLDELREKDFKFDKWGFVEILKSADRRFGKRTLEKFKDSFENPIALKLIKKRLGETNVKDHHQDQGQS